MATSGQVAKRIPLIKFPVRRPPPPSSPSSPAQSSGNATAVGGSVGSQASQSADSAKVQATVAVRLSDVPASPQHQGSGGSASIQPRRTPVTDREIEAIMLGGVF